MRVSDYLLTEEKELDFFSEEENTPGPEQGPTWEQIWFAECDANWYPADLRSYGPKAYEMYWEKWLADVIQPPPPDYYYTDRFA